MKKIMFLGFLAAAFAMTSCDKIEEAVNDLQKDQAPTYVESKDGLSITITYAKDGIGSETEATHSNQITHDRFGRQTQVGLYVTAALRHSVYFGLFEIQTLLQGCFTNDGSDGEDTLASHTG